MADPLSHLTPKQRAIIKQLGDLETLLENNMAGALPKIFATMSRDVQRVAAGLSLDAKNRAATLRELISLKRKLGDVVVNNPDYQREVQKLLNEFTTIKDLTDQFIGSTIDDYKPQKRLYEAIMKANVEITKDALLGGGIRENFANAIQEVLKSNLSGISDRATLYETLARFIEGTESQKGFLDRYIKQTTNDAIMVFGREYLQTVSEDLGIKHYLYQGTIIADTRPFCQSKAGKYFTKEEVEKWASQTWDGKMAGTNSTTIFAYAGGYNCRHKVWPVTEEQYNRAKGITPPATTPPSPPIVAPPPPGIPPQMTTPPVLPKPLPTPKPPKGFAGDTSGLPKTIDGLKKYINDSFEKNYGFRFPNTIVARDVSADVLSEQVAAIDKLSNMYRIDGKTQFGSKLMFQQTNDYYGRVVSSLFKGERFYTEVNFGSGVDPNRVLSRLPKNRISMPKSIVDEVNERIVTPVHEFAHFISTSRAFQPSSSQFWSEMDKLFVDYKQGIRADMTKIAEADARYLRTSPEFMKLEESFRRNYLGDYSQTNVDEFFAEGFTNFHLNSRPSKWASEIGKLVNKYFKK